MRTTPFLAYTAILFWYMACGNRTAAQRDAALATDTIIDTAV